MLYIITELTCNIVWWTTKQVCSMGYWMVNGNKKSKEEYLIENQARQINYLEHQLDEIRQLISGKTETEIIERQYTFI